MNQKARDAIVAPLNERQREAVCHGDGPLLIVAGAGTGKTTTLAHRVAWHIANGVDPRRVLLLTFTRRAAAEMLGRVAALLGRRSTARRWRGSASPVWGGTFHAVATRLLRRYGPAIGLSRQFSVLDRGDAEDLMGLVRRELKLAQTGSRFPQKTTCVGIYSWTVNTGQSVDDAVRQHYPWCGDWVSELKRLFEAYVDRKESQQALDYDDLLLFWSALLDDARTGEAIRRRFDCVLVDEYQDTNALQGDILRKLCPDGRGLTVVGDDAQSIYSFRGATVRNIHEFPEQFPGTTIVTLEENYRSTQPILDCTNKVIAQARKRYVKNLWSRRPGGERPKLVQCFDEDEQTRYVVDRILQRREEGVDLRQQAVLFRASHHSLNLEMELTRRNIPFHKYGGLKFVETAHVKDLVAILRLADNLLDMVAATRALQLLPGIGQRRCERLIGLLHKAGGDLQVWRDFSPPAATGSYWSDLLQLLDQLRSRGEQQGEVQADVAAVRKFYEPLVHIKYDNPVPRLRDLEQLEKMAVRYRSRLDFLTELTLDPPSSTQDLPDAPWKDDDFLVLSTIHSAKGLEWDTVYVIHAADGNIPSDMATDSPERLDEELRLFYVAMTRAKNQLHVCHPLRYYFAGRRRGDEHSYSMLTRFLPRTIHRLMELVDAEEATQAEEDDRFDSLDVPEQVPRSSSSDVRRRQKKRW